MRRRDRQPVEYFCVQRTLTIVESEDAVIVDRVRSRLVDQVTDWLAATGHLSTGPGQWDSVLSDEFATVRIRLTVPVEERTDGEWPAIRAAIAEDEHDRELAAAGHGDLSSDVSDRLDALRGAVDYWADRELRGL